MPKKIKLKDNYVLDASSVAFNRSILADIFNNNSKGATGYMEIGGGLVIQWGTSTGTGYKAFPKPFNNGCLFVMTDGAWDSGSNPAYKTLSGVDSWDKNGCYIGSFGYIHVGNYGENINTQSYRSINGVPNFAGTTRWLAIGY